MKDSVFFDTNLLIYMADNRDSAKTETATSLILLDERFHAIISFQVVQEFFNTCLKKGFLSNNDLTQFIKEIVFPMWEIYPTRDLYLNTLEIQSSYQYSFNDSLIIASALEGKCRTLYSEDLHHGQQIENLTIIDPFK